MKYPSLEAAKRDMTERRQSIKLTMSQHKYELVSHTLLTEPAWRTLCQFPKMPGFNDDLPALKAICDEVSDHLTAEYRPVTLDKEIKELETLLADNPDFAIVIHATLQFAKQQNITLTARHKNKVRPRELVERGCREIIGAWCDRYSIDAALYLAEWEHHAATVENSPYELRKMGARIDNA